jgi:hypothetical protein
VPPAPCDVENINVPPDGAIVYESPGKCVIKVNDGAISKFPVDAAYDDNGLLKVEGVAHGLDNASHIPVNITAGGGTCRPLGPATAYYTGSIAFSVTVRDN